MQAAFIESFGGPGHIQYGELPDPVPGPGEVLVRTEAVAVNSVDTYVRSGAWRTPVRFPLAVGRDLVGTVVVTGADVAEFTTGDRVWTNSAGYGGRPGATAELAMVAQDRLYRLPDGADPVPFVAAVHPGATAYGALIRRARLRPGETVAVAGANGAVGMCLVQAAASCDATPLAVVRAAAEPAMRRLLDLGASDVLVAGDASEAAAVAAGAAKNGVDVLIDATGWMDLGQAAQYLNPRGRIVPIAGRNQRIELDQWSFYTRELQLLGFIMSAMTAGELAAAAAWINVRSPAVSVGRVLPFPDAALAHALVERGELPRLPDHTVGRLVLQP
jgi:NADPH:quinone reductase-like Zn-dependent oxidoreductase